MSENNTHVPGMNHRQDHYIVCIGASAGGMEAIHEIFDHMPLNTGYSFVVIQHLSTDHKSLMAELLSKHTRMRVVEATDQLPVEANTVYVIPNTKNITIRNRKLLLNERQDTKAPNMAIDIFLNSLAREAGSKAIAIILSGTGSDGTRGIAAIKREGGLVFVQDPSTAKFDGMPLSAIESGKIDFILSPESIAEELMMHTTAPGAIIVDNLPDEDEPVLQEIFHVIHAKTSCDFKSYKRPTLIRRLTRRMSLLNIRNPADFLEYLKTNDAEAATLCKEFLIGVTKFFRDPEAFDELRMKVIPEIVRSKQDGGPIKIWVVGCSTGEEAYSIAMLMKEQFHRTHSEPEIKIFASDINKESVEFASKGIYPQTIADDVPKELLEKYFHRERDQYVVSTQIRKIIVFSHHDLLKDAPFSRLDLVVCRNMMIYLSPAFQKRIMNVFHFALNLGGYLFLGPSEHIGYLKESVTEVSKKWKIFRISRLTSTPVMDALAYSGTRKIHPGMKIQREIAQKAVVELLVNIVMEEYVAAGVLVEGQCNVLDTFGNYRKYLELPERKFDNNLLKMLPGKTAILVGSNFKKAMATGEKIILKNVLVKDSETALANVIIRPFDDKFNNRIAFIVFTDVHQDKRAALPARHEKNVLQVDGRDGPDFQDLLRLENELKETREVLQRAIEDSETSNEELQSSNEELISANEELQSTNEELQSLNEELHTVNAEHQLRIKEISELNDDLNNYFRSTDIAKIFLDSDLHIRKYSAPATSIFNLIESDIGRPINHISNHLKYKELFSDIRRVMETSDPVNKIIEVWHNRWYQLKILPYLREGRNMDGAVLVFIDISAIRKAQAELSEEVKARRALEEMNEKLNHMNEQYKMLTEELEMRVEQRTRDLMEANEKLVKSNKELEQFAHIASHDLHEPLRKIQTFAELTERHWKEEPAAKKYLEKIATSSSRMSALIDDVLKYSRLTRSTEKPGIADLNEIVDKVRKEFEEQIASKDAVIESGPLPRVKGIPSQIEQLFSNLLSNSLRFSKLKVRIRITARHLTRKEIGEIAELNRQLPYVEINFTDNGIGFEEQHARQIFTIFAKLNDNNLYTGAGIGLALCKRIVENHQGAIIATGEEGSGATFKVYLPAAENMAAS